jgi:hypothetical protein
MIAMPKGKAKAVIALNETTAEALQKAITKLDRYL